MNKLSIDEILHKINRKECFEAHADDESFSIHIRDYVPFVCTAPHAGHRLRGDLKSKILLDENERWYEEDPMTDLFVSSLPIRLVGLDSRYEYDLNRDPAHCIYDLAWGKQVWREPLSDEDRAKSLSKHQRFYQVLDTLLEVILGQFKTCTIYDIHSFNHKRIAEFEAPVFNLGTYYINATKNKRLAQQWLKLLAKIEVPHLATVVAENQVFEGRGYLAEYVSGRYPDALVLPTEIKKVYCDEENGDTYPEVIEALRLGIKTAIVQHAKLVNKNRSRSAPKVSMLSSQLDPHVLKTDETIFRLSKNLELLEYINPMNIASEKRRFFASRYRSEPVFTYRPLKIDPFEFKEKIYRCPYDKIEDPHLFELYKTVIESQAAQIDLIASRGEKQFLYNSLRYFGEPSDRDLRDARWLLHSPEEAPEEANISAAEALKRLTEFVDHYQLPGTVEIGRNMAAKAVFMISKKRVKLSQDASFSRSEIERLGHHEVGVHMLTTFNALEQPLKLLQFGFPIYTVTQEGIAIASEYFTGHMSLTRLKELALRVVAVHSMVRGASFADTFEMLVDQFQLDLNRAFYVCVRAYRGGGMTKDYLYLTGFKDIVSKVEAGVPIQNLLLGKTSLDYLDLLNELVERKVLHAPRHIADFLKTPKASSPVLDFVIRGICA